MSDRDSQQPETDPDSYLNGVNSAYLEQQYEQYLSNPNSLDLQWRQHFDQLPKKSPHAPAEISESEIRQQFYRFADSSQNASSNCNVSLAHERQQVRVLQLINAYRFLSHQAASCNPLGNAISANLSELTLAYHQLTKNDLNTLFQTGSWVGPTEATLQEILYALQRTYGSSIGFEYMHIIETDDKRWLQHRIESVQAHPKVNYKTRRWLLNRLTAAEGIERYLHAKYVGQKRFSLEGGESLIPLMAELIERAGSKGVAEIVIGMAHRGRLNMLVNILGKTPSQLFSEFEGQHAQRHSDGDVKYHQGFSSDMHTSGKNVHLVLAFNPSHLEIVAPMVEGSVRARQDRRDDPHGDTVLPIAIHGDSAFAGQGVVMETLSLSQSRGFSTKGTIHIVINNQIGFTTSNVQDTRSTFYCTDIAKMINVPVFHVNGDDPEAVLFVTQLALDYRMAFKKDVIIDLVCYRRQGHNEADEPSATQPMMYKHIRSMLTTRALYAQKLEKEGVIQTGEAEQMIENYRQQLEHGDSVCPKQITDPAFIQQYGLDWQRFKGHKWNVSHDSRYDLHQLQELANQLQPLPSGFTLHPRVEKIMEDRRKMSAGALPIDWGYAETMAYATLLKQDYSIRLCGQDSGRGTFFHRHAVLHNQQDGESYVPLRNLPDVQSNFLVIDSLLSEEAVLAFEYGYSATSPDHLVIWEAQFGDFANGAQVVIDQFISSGEAKWGRLCNLVMLLPHGYEGQGAEHSSARLERYLQLCAEHNMQICVPTTPAQVFHMLRRQMLRPYRKPLVVMSPKSLLRHKLATSSLNELAKGHFQNVIGELDPLPEASVKRIVLCSGKVYYELLQQRRALKLEQVVLIRIEQLYPFPRKELDKQLQRYPNAEAFYWCQEEPMNQGAWYSSQHHIRQQLDQPHSLRYAGRPASAAPAVGYPSLHAQQLKDLLREALGHEE